MENGLQLDRVAREAVSQKLTPHGGGRSLVAPCWKEVHIEGTASAKALR